MRTKFILVDYENVPEIDLSVLSGEDTRALVFVGVKQPALRTDLVLKIQGMGIRGEFVKCTGVCKNALDHILAFRLGQLTRDYPDAEFLIVSGDKGFDVLVAHMKSEKVSAKRIESSKSESKPFKQKKSKARSIGKSSARNRSKNDTSESPDIHKRLKGPEGRGATDARRTPDKDPCPICRSGR